MKKIEDLSAGRESCEIPGAKYDRAPCATCYCPESSCAFDCGQETLENVTLGLMAQVTLCSIAHPVQ